MVTVFKIKIVSISAKQTFDDIHFFCVFIKIIIVNLIISVNRIDPVINHSFLEQIKELKRESLFCRENVMKIEWEMEREYIYVQFKPIIGLVFGDVNITFLNYA